MTSAERIKEASDRIADLLTDLETKGYDYRMLRLALIDAAVRLARAALNDWENKAPVADILRAFASLVREMAKDEEALARREEIRLVEEEP